MTRAEEVLDEYMRSGYCGICKNDKYSDDLGATFCHCWVSDLACKRDSLKEKIAEELSVKKEDPQVSFASKLLVLGAANKAMEEWKKGRLSIIPNIAGKIQ